jgi:hypothetical protein
MSDRKLRVTISPKGAVTTKVEGICGTGCDAFAAGIERALGRTTSETKTDDYYAQETVEVKEEA